MKFKTVNTTRKPSQRDVISMRQKIKRKMGLKQKMNIGESILDYQQPDQQQINDQPNELQLQQQEEQSQSHSIMEKQHNPQDEANENEESFGNAQQIQQKNQEGDLMKLLQENEKNLQDYQQQIGNRGVIYMSRIPPYMTPNYIRKLLSGYQIERIYLLPESDWARQNRIKHGGSKRICFREGWIQFTDKKTAKMAELTLNGQKMVHKKGTFYSEDIWNLKYLAKFKWHHLTQKLAHEQRMKKQRLKLQIDQQRKVQQYYTNQVQKSKTIKGIIKNKISKGRQKQRGKERRFGQKSMLSEERD